MATGQQLVVYDGSRWGRVGKMDAIGIGCIGEEEEGEDGRIGHG